MASTMIEQGMFMDNIIFSFAIPPASLPILSMFSVLIWVPVYETILVPFARRFTGKDKGFSQTQRLGIGLMLSMLSMVYAALASLGRGPIQPEAIAHSSLRWMRQRQPR
jgi:solute carrier family 15 (peptide/histidine transporter), member 3/4